MSEQPFNPGRRRFLQVSGATGALAGSGLTLKMLTPPQAEARENIDARPWGSTDTQITKNVCHQCPARCGIDVYTTNCRVHGIYGTIDHPISNGRLCPKGHLGTYLLYDPDRFKGPMRRTNPKKGRDVDPGFVPISWDDALDIVAKRLNDLRKRDESYRFALLYGRGWGASDAGLQGDFGKLYGSPNVAIGHSSICSDGSMIAKEMTDGNQSYNAYDYDNTNYILNFGAGFLEAFRPYNNNMQVWGRIRTKSPKTRVVTVDVRMSTTMAASDRALMIKPGTDGALALAIAHVMLTEGLWDREFVGDFYSGKNQFRAGETINPEYLRERWVKDLARWWNEEVKDRTPAWASEITTLPEKAIVEVAREFGSTRPAIALFERGPTAHSNGCYNGMAIHALNALTGALFAEGGLFYQMGVPYGALPVNARDFMDDHARNMQQRIGSGEVPRIDMKGTDRWPMVKNMQQEIGPNSLLGDPYKLDTIMFYLNNPIWTSPNPQVWEDAMRELFVIDTSPYPGETAMFADLVLPDHTYLERLQDAPTYPFRGYPMTQIRTPAIKPVHDTKVYGDTLIEIGKRIDGPMGDYYRALGSTENVIRHLAKGFEENPGDNGVNSFDSWKEKGVWYRKPYHWRQIRGEFYEWDGERYSRRMTESQVAEKLLKTPSGKFELVSTKLTDHADYIHRELGIAPERAGLIQWLPPVYTGKGNLHLVTPKLALHAEGRGANLPQALAYIQPIAGGRGNIFLEINPRTARNHGIGNGDRVRLKSNVGEITATARYSPGQRPDVLVLPMELGHWAQGRWAKNRGPGHSGELTENKSDAITGLASYYSGMVSIERA
ncbi:MAG: molybdopterin-dependent oxidoreductase [Alcanivoracaceae bacterium]